MKPLYLPLLALVVLTGCGREKSAPSGENAGTRVVALADARKGFQTQLARRESANEPVPEPPAAVFRTVRYDAPVGKLAAYLTPDPRDGKRHPAIIWITGGDCNSIGDVWTAQPASNDQTASAFRQAGVVLMFPSLRGGNDNPGVREGFFGEVDDVLAAADFLARQEYVDPARIYLGGHSTGGTLALLVAEYTDRFRAVFSFGPVDDVRGYGPEYAPFAAADPREAELRAPGRWLASIKTPTFVIEGTADGNLDCLRNMARVSTNPRVQFLAVRGANHFSVLAPTTKRIAARLLRDDGPACNLAFTEDELSRAFGR
ncbi:MAG: prolyl oligopeptidase family serine peptidase [Gemmataceae bacterium]